MVDVYTFLKPKKSLNFCSSPFLHSKIPQVWVHFLKNLAWWPLIFFDANPSNGGSCISMQKIGFSVDTLNIDHWDEITSTTLAAILQWCFCENASVCWAHSHRYVTYSVKSATPSLMLLTNLLKLLLTLQLRTPMLIKYPNQQIYTFRQNES